MNSWWKSFDKSDRMMFMNMVFGAAVTLAIWWVMVGRNKYAGKGMK